MRKLKGFFYVVVFAWLIGTLLPDNEQDAPKRTSAPTTVSPSSTKLTAKPKTPAATPKPSVNFPSAVFEYRYVDASRLNVRNGPGKEYKVIWTLKRDEKVRVDHIEGDWSFLIGERFKGWVFSTYLTPHPTPQKVVRSPAKPQTKKLTDRAIVKILIERSLAYYSGNCPCPYNRDRAGRKCGRRSAYSRPGGAEPLCFAGDITPRMIADYRAREE